MEIEIDIRNRTQKYPISLSYNGIPYDGETLHSNFRKISERLNGRWAFKIHFRSISVNDCIGTIDRALHEKYLTR